MRAIKEREALEALEKDLKEEFGLEMTSVYTEDGRLVRMDQGGGISVRVEP